jgi:hypothetical protein
VDVEVLVDTVSETRETSNVIAETEPSADGEVTMAGAHPRLGEGGPGINDNGSGIAALLEIARRTRDVKGLRLGFWTAEELACSLAPLRPDAAEDARESIRAYINLDMVGTPKGKVVGLRHRRRRGGHPARRDRRTRRGGSRRRLRPRAVRHRGDPGRRHLHRAGPLLPPRLRHAENTDAALAAAQARSTQDALTELAR